MARNYPVTHLRPPLADSQAEELNVCTMLEEGNDGDRIDTTASKQATEAAEAAAAAAAEAKAEVQRLRQALTSEEEACAEARAELEVAGSGSEASEADRLRLLLSQEKTKSRALGERALRSERHRQKLLEEMVQDGQADVELVSLAKAVGRTVKAIASISKEALMFDGRSGGEDFRRRTGNS
ncbi:unnamed protein product [Cladocopium goreaui]|uniref:Uncharacterized protein n=1 Tax=Cladocopium goreaui TaxID=2562237 RepID=A0A9P1C8Q7_9DINO|nr:unnamed protein product [Cladocopium goreaui]